MSEKTVLSLRGIEKEYKTSYGYLQALKGIDMDMQEGEFVSIMGRSGSGKSTLLHILATILTPTKGSYTLRGKQMDTLGRNELCRIRRQEIGVVFQQYELLREYTVWENIAMPLFLDHEKPDEEYLKELGERCGVLKYFDEYPDRLSGGEQQRVALIRAMAHKPSILLADEPTGNLDYKTGMEIMHLISDCRSSFGQTIVMVTHDNECASYADRIICMEDGHFV